ncbi:MBL fold metallo-hydrolase [Candidatus Methylacidiphilum infernorum]|uniref:MBL fold metallo-hydrolase n=1 Tax=Candidatus Methylacidiphilum infernorum TaxID=511746 RepID=UPI001650CB89|nr:MBL fold metallo-hydrolase [Candidatus Methylacidiphilum infernorum]
MKGQVGEIDFFSLFRTFFLYFVFLPLFSLSFFPPCWGETERQVLIRWYGHAFVYLISSTGVRVAIDPYGDETVKYRFPDHLQADVVLISSEAEDRSAGEKLYGTPQIFRSITAVGPNNARGHIFKGIQTFRDKSQGSLHGKNTAFVFKLDHITFAHLGDLAHTLTKDQLAEFGKVDVLFLPIGNEILSNDDLDKITSDLGARLIIPIAFKTTLSGDLDIRPLDKYLEGKHNVKMIDSSELLIGQSDLPSEPWIYVLKEP